MIIAARQGVNQRREAWEEPPLDLIEPLLIDREPYLRKNLGPYAIGDGLLLCHPEPTLDRLRQWVNDSREQVGWNVAMAFRSYGGTRYLKEAMEIPEELVADQRRFFWRAAASALLYLGRRYPEIVRPIL